MAIHSFYESVVMVNGAPLQEYDNDDDVTKQKPNPRYTTVVKYVEGVSGANFSIRFRLLPDWVMNDDLVFASYLDGTFSTSEGLSLSSAGYDRCSWTVEGVAAGSGDEWYLKRYRFADLVTGDGTGNLTPQEIRDKYSSLGLIRVEIWRVHLHSPKPVDVSAASASGSNLGTVPEKALKGKALSLSAGLGEAVRTKRHEQCKSIYHDKHPLVAFEFKYRSRTALQQLMIIPRSPTPDRSEKKLKDQLTDGEARELKRRQKARAETGTPKSKSESTTKLKRARSSTTTDPNTKPAKIANTADGRECIDLASDSEDERVKPERLTSKKDSKKKNEEVEVVDLLD